MKNLIGSIIDKLTLLKSERRESTITNSYNPITIVLLNPDEIPNILKSLKLSHNAKTQKKLTDKNMKRLNHRS